MSVIPEHTFDVIVIGGGPGGCSAATYLRAAGARVLVLEKDIFPRFHIGESLLPYNRVLFEEMGVAAELVAAGFPQKYGAQFQLGRGDMKTRFLFREGRFTSEPAAIQVERATFDHILLKHARARGADIREGWTVLHFSASTESTIVSAKDPDGQTHHFESKFLIDASGRGNLTGNQEGLRVMDSNLKKIAVFGHFSGVSLDEGEQGGDTVITRLANKWFWLIPVSATKTSVGLVLDREEFQHTQGGPTEVFRSWLDQSPAMRSRMQDAKLIGQLQTTCDFSYMNRRLVGQRLVRVGDAAGFIDPIFSTGVYLAMWSGKNAARAIADSLQAGDGGTRRFLAYERQVRRSMRFYRGMVDGFYTTPFMELFMNPRHGLGLPSAINAMLAGNLENTWALRWRTWLFFLFVRIQATFPLVPRISFTDSRPASRDLGPGAGKA